MISNQVSLHFVYLCRRKLQVKEQDRGLEDVELVPGWGPFVEESAYQDFISNYVDQPEVSILCYLIREH